MRGGVANHPLRKQHSWSPDIEREEAWTRRKDVFRRGGREGRSLTDDDLDELRGCIDLGFGFDVASVDGAKKLTRSFPALDLYYAVHKGCTACCSSSSGSVGEASGGSSPMSIVSPGDTPELVKTRLKQWAQVVGCAVRQHY